MKAGRFDGPEAAARALCSVEKGFEPRPEVGARYDKVYGLYTRLYQAAEPLFNGLEELRI